MGAAELFFDQLRTVEGSPADTAPLYKNPDLLLTDQVFHAKGISDYALHEDTCVDEKWADTSFSYYSLQLI